MKGQKEAVQKEAVQKEAVQKEAVQKEAMLFDTTVSREVQGIYREMEFVRRNNCNIDDGQVVKRSHE